MALQARLAAAEETEGAPTGSGDAGDQQRPDSSFDGSDDVEPFGLEYDLSGFNFDEEGVANGLRVLIALTNLL